jgi:hypothetical protein
MNMAGRRVLYKEECRAAVYVSMAGGRVECKECRQRYMCERQAEESKCKKCRQAVVYVSMAEATWSQKKKKVWRQRFM